MKSTVRFHMNTDEVNLAHNTDEKVRAREKHIKSDPSTGHILYTWCAKYPSPEAAIADILAGDLDAYNKKQTRKERRMTMEEYIQSVRDDKRGNSRKVRCRKSDGKTGYKYEKREHKRLAYEIVTSCGNSSCEKNADGTVRYDKNNRHIRPQEVPYEVNYAVNKRYYETFEKRNPNLIIISCVWHNDEGFYNKKLVWEYGTPHMQLVYVPIATGYKQGLARQVSIGKALKNMGYEDTYEEVTDENGNVSRQRVCAYTLWERAEEKYFEELFQEEYEKYCKKHKAYAKKHGELEIIHPVQERKKETETVSLAPDEYAEQQRLREEIAELSAQRDEYFALCQMLSQVKVKSQKSITYYA